MHYITRRAPIDRRNKKCDSLHINRQIITRLGGACIRPRRGKGREVGVKEQPQRRARARAYRYMFNIDFNGHCTGCHFDDGPGTLATIGSQLHLLVFVGIWVYSFIHRDIFIWTVNTMASFLLALCHIFHKIDVLGSQPPCLDCIAAIYDRFYDLEGSAVPSAPVALVCYYMLVMYACPLELGSAYRHDSALRYGKRGRHHYREGAKLAVHSATTPRYQAPSAAELMTWDPLKHLDVLIVPCWSAAARLYAGLTTPMGVVSGAIIGAGTVILLFKLVRSNWFRCLVRYAVNDTPLTLCGISICPIPGVSATLHFLGFETRFLDIMWNNLDNTISVTEVVRL